MEPENRVSDLGQEPIPVERLDFSRFPEIDRKTILKEVPSGTISMELGADGAYLRFDCNCLDALPYCKAQCCALIGTMVLESEYERGVVEVDLVSSTEATTKRDCDGFCTYLDRRSRMCQIYNERPQTCKEFHCTRGVGMRGWKLSNRVHRQSAI